MNASPTEPNQASTPRGSRLLGLDDFELQRRRGIALLIVTSVLLVAYWVLWFADRGAVSSNHTAQYISFEQSFPLADGWLLGAALVAAIQAWRRRPSALMWLFIFGGAGVYLCALDVLYDLEHGIYSMGHGGTSELAINLATAMVSIGALRVGWRFRHALLGDSTEL
jgi:hypothetical protein